MSDDIEYSEWIEATKKYLESLPDDYRFLMNKLTSMDREFWGLVAERLEPAFNQEIQSRDSERYGQRKKLAVWANEEVGSLGLAFQSPSTGLGSMLSVDPGKLREGRYIMQHRTAATENGLERSDAFASLPTLKLTPTTLNQPDWDRWAFVVRSTKNQNRGERSC